MRIQIALMTAALFLAIEPAPAQITQEAASALAKPVEIERNESVTTVPLRKHMGKLAIDATVNGIEQEFVFDTGSPSMLSRDLAEKLGLEIIGSNTGRDANGRNVTTDIAIVDRLSIGGVTFRSVPVLIHDFSSIDPNGCFFAGGVIGSEIFPGSAWRIDTERQLLQIAARAEALSTPDVSQPLLVAPLHDFGYPHAPVFDYRIGSFEDRGLFDTGSSETITLFARVAQDTRVKQAMIPDSIRVGRGSEGVSAGGVGAETDLLRFEIDSVRLGNVDLGRRPGTVRQSPPTLIGLGILATHLVTLDYQGSRILLHQRAAPEPERSHPGFALMPSGNRARVVQLFRGSAAKKAGLKLGDEVVAIDDQELSSDGAPCALARRLADSRSINSARYLTVLREGERVRLHLVDR